MVIILQSRLEEYLVVEIVFMFPTPSVRTGRRQTAAETRIYSVRRFSV